MLGRAQITGTEIQNLSKLSEGRLTVYIFGDLCTPSNLRLDSSRKIYETERLDWMRGSRNNQESPKISNYFSLYDVFFNSSFRLKMRSCVIIFLRSASSFSSNWRRAGENSHDWKAAVDSSWDIWSFKWLKKYLARL